MKSFWKDLGYACMMGLILPWLVLSVSISLTRMDPVPEEAELPRITQKEAGIIISVLDRDEVKQIELEEYLVGVVLAEMPASFETEALKAQSVVARTYALRSYMGSSKHEAAALCTDSACCQSYISGEDYLSRGGTEDSLGKVRDAVAATTGQVLTYQGQLIEATYFSCSGGRTEDAVAVWGTDVAYLRSVESPGEENAAHFRDTATFTPEQFCAALSIRPKGEPEDWFGKHTYTAGGGVDSLEICGITYSGTQLRSLLGLRSAAFSVTVDSDAITFETRGYGHRVGMSQYGADAMAAAGSDYAGILAHYYQGTELIQAEIDKATPLG